MAIFDLKKFILDLLFPIECLGCKQEGEWLCPKCLKKIGIDFSGRPFVPDLGGELRGVWVASDYKNPLLAQTLQVFKYKFIPDLGQILGRLLTDFLKYKIKNKELPDFDLVLAVPLAKKRKLWRGFNQAEILARAVCRELGREYGDKIINRKFHVHPQVGLKLAQRLVNVKDIFTVNDELKVENKKILLVDDVVTTGATMNECAKALVLAGAKEVWGLVVAKG
ncbi:MAG: hypothetical protein A3H67_02105 [Candidatus Buchananbacteria bacterium RIFCSPLOWO2_02_FULL_46_11b]|uniref:Phosphoribosyltransferase domain-containing protein n=2 Tax=Candidatus Buchananiibacteriota TaxID=1817903 RepID=A0A1G1YQ38_9BACT|nr:MAG: hypothetical protein A3B15_02490 [Candidatus Buchananbacteria bacterium RIFCSPLOWO2_01_FULL_45_31]OGY57212.1 MAG: hypothetical protein A3H67_02105 [Candidatus Buchananbacteria bacterium RIFCSPLOWO2_02_FULL_46_11b]